MKSAKLYLHIVIPNWFPKLIVLKTVRKEHLIKNKYVNKGCHFVNSAGILNYHAVKEQNPGYLVIRISIVAIQ